MAVDFSKRDVRGLSEELQFLQLKDQFTGEPIEDEDGPAGFMIRGAISRTAQSKLNKLFAAARRKSEEARRRKEAIEAAEVVSDNDPDASKIRARAAALADKINDDEGGFEAAHQSALDEAMCYIHSAVNFTWGDEGPVGDNPELIRKILDTSFPILEPDENGKLRAVNTTYAKQVVAGAEEYGRFLDSQPKG